MMKKLIHILLVTTLFTMAFTACKQDKNNEDPAQSALIGKWKVLQFDVDLSIAGISLADYLVDSLGFSAQEVTIAEAVIRSETNDVFEEQTITFNSNNTYEVTLDGEPESGSWLLNDDQTILTIITNNDRQIALAVSSLSSEVLEIGLNEQIETEESLDNNQFGITLTEALQIDGDFTLIKESD